MDRSPMTRKLKGIIVATIATSLVYNPELLLKFWEKMFPD